MSNNDILVIQCNAFLNKKEMDNLIKYFHKSKEAGVVVIPPYCSAIICPKDIELKVENNIDEAPTDEIEEFLRKIADGRSTCSDDIKV